MKFWAMPEIVHRPPDDPGLCDTLRAKRQSPPERTQMTDKNVDEAKGRAKEAAGAVTDDKGLKREGKADQAKSSVKGAVDRAAETAKSLFGRKRK